MLKTQLQNERLQLEEQLASQTEMKGVLEKV